MAISNKRFHAGSAHSKHWEVEDLFRGSKEECIEFLNDENNRINNKPVSKHWGWGSVELIRDVKVYEDGSHSEYVVKSKYGSLD